MLGDWVASPMSKRHGDRAIVGSVAFVLLNKMRVAVVDVIEIWNCLAQVVSYASAVG